MVLVVVMMIKVSGVSYDGCGGVDDDEWHGLG